MHTAATSHPCPRDGHPLTSVADNGMRMESCGSCGGLWVPMAQLLPRLSSRASALLFQSKGGRETLLRCPIDGAAMREFDVGGAHIDRCESCRGLWFDPGELSHVFAIGVTTKDHPDAGGWLDSADVATHVGEAVGEGLLHGVGDVVSTIAEFIGSALSP